MGTSTGTRGISSASHPHGVQQDLETLCWAATKATDLEKSSQFNALTPELIYSYEKKSFMLFNRFD